MENLIYSLNATIPVFVVILAGWILRQIGMLNDNFVSVSNKFNFKVTLPILLFCDIKSMNIREVFEWRFFLFCAVVTTVCFFVVWFFAERCMKKCPESIGSFVQGSFRGSAAVLGVAFMQNIYGNAGLAPLMIIGCVPLYNIFSVIVLTLRSSDRTGSGKDSIKKACINICKNPIILAILAGLPFSFFQVEFPEMVDKTLGQFAAIATPLALIAIGAAFEGKQALAKIKPTIWGSLIKLVFQPLVFLPLAVLMGFRGQHLVTLLIMLGAPSTASCYIMAKNMGNDSVLSASIIVVTTLGAAVTITAGLYVLKVLALI